MEIKKNQLENCQNHQGVLHMFTRMMWLFHNVIVLQSSIRMGSPYQSDSMRRGRDVREGICYRMIYFSYYCKYGVLVLVMTGQALLMSPKGRNASRDGLIKLWKGGFYYLQYYYIVK